MPPYLQRATNYAFAQINYPCNCPGTGHGHHSTMRGSRAYRPEIDGLRAVAVAAVIANHFNEGVLPGGYLGVDIFFVISGYVISSSLAREVDRPPGDFFANFYVRRIKRLLPALAVCVLVTAILGSAFIDPSTADYRRIMMSGAWALLGASNIYLFAKATDYFAFATELNPFVHTWSLGVEEQFYLVFPALFLWLAAGRRKGEFSSRALVFAGLVILSLCAFLWLLMRSPPAAYFLMPMRFWELGLGYLAFAYGGRARFLQGGWVSWGAATMLGVSLSLPATLQNVGTFFVVVASGMLLVSLRSGLVIYSVLTLRPIVWIGLISYSLYLWHWSVLSLSRWTIGVDTYTAPFQLLAMLALATVSYYALERPLRYHSWSAAPLRTIGYGIIASVSSFLLVIALAQQLRGKFYTGVPATMAEVGVDTLSRDRWLNGKLLWRAGECILTSNSDVGKAIDLQRCVLGGDKGGRRFLVIGNSFSAAEVDLFDILRERGLGSVIVTSAWGASPTAEILNRTPWSEANDHYWRSVIPALLDKLERGDFLVMVSDVASLTPRDFGEADAENVKLLTQGLARIADAMASRGVNVIFQSAIPYIRDARCTPTMATRQWFNVSEPAVCNYYSKDATLKRRKPLDEVLTKLERNHPNFHVLDLLPTLCPEETCKMRLDDGTYLYRDISSHLSVEANKRARPALMSVVERALSRTSQSARD